MFTLSYSRRVVFNGSRKIVSERWSIRLVVFLLLVTGCGRTPVSQTDSSSEVDSISKIASSVESPLAEAGFHDRSGLDWSEISFEPRWSAKTGAGYSSPVVKDGRIYLFHRQDDQELIDCRELETGKLVWQFGSSTQFKGSASFSSGPCSTPVVDSSTVYALGTEAKLYCLSRENGEIRQLRDLKLDYEPNLNGRPLSGRLILHRGAAIVAVGGTKNESSIVAINCKTGATLWHAIDDGRCYSSPRSVSFNDKIHLLLGTENYFWSLDPRSGKLNWKYEFASSRRPEFFNAADALVVGNQIILPAGKERKLVCLRVEPSGNPKELWTSKIEPLRYQSNLIASGGFLFLAQENVRGQTELKCFDLAKGNVCWKKPLTLARPTMLLFRNEIILFGENGFLEVWKASSRNAHVVYRTKSPLLGGPCRTMPLLANGLLILRDEQELIAIEVEKRAMVKLQ